MARIIYGHWTQYDNKQQLCEAPKEAARTMDGDFLSTLAPSVKKRAMKVLERGGRHIAY